LQAEKPCEDDKRGGVTASALVPNDCRQLWLVMTNHGVRASQFREQHPHWQGNESEGQAAKR
jgi:hypothetical protein